MDYKHIKFVTDCSFSFIFLCCIFSISSRPVNEAVAVVGEQGQGLEAQRQQQQAVPQRQVAVRRIQIAFQLDLLLILKLAAVIFLFNQDGSIQNRIVFLDSF